MSYIEFALIHVICKRRMTSLTTLVRVSPKKAVTPGPGQYVVPPKFGKEGTHPTLNPRREDKALVRGPGYEAIPSTFGEGPKWTFHGRPEQRPPKDSPGPAYMPPKLGQEAPASGFHGYVANRKSYEQGPGPGQYVVPSTIGKTGWTFKERRFPPDEGTISGPGPGKYNPNFKAVMNGPQTMAYRPPVQVREKEDKTPGPGQYVIKRDLAQSAMSFHGFVREAKKDECPGPKYDVPHGLGRDAPKFTIRSRHDVDPKIKGAPYQAIPSAVGQGPKWSFGARTGKEKIDPAPGPSYMPPAFGKEARASSMFSRRDVQKREAGAVSPGPGKYLIPGAVGETGKKYTLKARQFPPNEGGASGPGPGKYNPNFMDAPTAVTIHSRLVDPKDKEPAPKYVNLPPKFGTEGPMFTIGRREELDLAAGLV